LELANEVVDTLKRGDGPGLTALVDTEMLAFRALMGVQVTDLQRANLKAQLTNLLAQLGDEIMRTAGPSPRPAFVRILGLDAGCKRILVRLDRGELGLHYMAFFACVGKGPEGWAWTIFDWYDYARGQTHSDTLKMAVALIQPNQQHLYREFFGLAAPDAGVVEKLQRLGRHSFEGDWAGWLQVYRTLPEEARNSRALLIGRQSAAGIVGDRQEYLNALQAMETHHGDDVTLSLFLLDYYVLQGDFRAARSMIDRLKRLTFDAPGIADIRAGVALRQGDAISAMTHARLAISLDPGFESPYWNLIRAGATAGDYQAAMKGVTGLRERFGYELSATDLMERGDFRKLVESEAWRADY